MRKLFLVLSLTLCLCSCVSNAKNINIFPNSEIDNDTVSTVYLADLYQKDLSSYTLFDTYRTFIPSETIYVMQVIRRNVALAHVAYKHYEYGDGYKDRYDNLVLLIGDQDEYFYDDQAISVPKTSEVKQIGVYTYTTTKETVKTVPMVRILSAKE